MSTISLLTTLLASPAGAVAALVLHLVGATGFVLYGAGQAHLLWYYVRRPRRGAPPPLPADPRDWPHVTVQVPMYNEQYVAALVIDACAALEWPRDRFELQLLDDSQDETVAIVDERAAYWRARGVTVEVVRRAERTGYTSSRRRISWCARWDGLPIRRWALCRGGGRIVIATSAGSRGRRRS